jgi:hypothetical protein
VEQAGLVLLVGRGRHRHRLDKLVHPLDESSAVSAPLVPLRSVPFRSVPFRSVPFRSVSPNARHSSSQLQERDESVAQRSDRTEILAARSALTIGDSRRSTSDRPGMANSRQFLKALNRALYNVRHAAASPRCRHSRPRSCPRTRATKHAQRSAEYSPQFTLISFTHLNTSVPRRVDVHLSGPPLDGSVQWSAQVVLVGGVEQLGLHRHDRVQCILCSPIDRRSP